MDITKIELDSNLESKLHEFSWVTASTAEVANAIAERARELAPVETGRYRDGIVVDSPNGKGVARVHATDQKSSWVEFGTHDHPAQFILRTAVESLGLKFKKGK
jgi:Bacteriophage HK97-gp10, putative tail-component